MGASLETTRVVFTNECVKRLYHFLYMNDSTESQRKSNREKYPEIAAFVDELRKYFPDAKVVKITPRSPTNPELDEADGADDQK